MLIQHCSNQSCWVWCFLCLLGYSSCPVIVVISTHYTLTFPWRLAPINLWFFFFFNTLEQRSDFFLLTCLIASCSRALREEKRNKQRGKREATKSNYVFLIKTKHETGMTYSMYSTHTCTWRSSYLLFDRGQNGGGRLRFRSVSIRGWHHRGNHGPLLLLHRLLWHRHHYY